jgi:hypothetical protein
MILNHHSNLRLDIPPYLEDLKADRSATELKNKLSVCQGATVLSKTGSRTSPSSCLYMLLHGSFQARESSMANAMHHVPNMHKSSLCGLGIELNAHPNVRVRARRLAMYPAAEGTLVDRIVVVMLHSAVLCIPVRMHTERKQTHNNLHLHMGGLTSAREEQLSHFVKLRST